MNRLTTAFAAAAMLAVAAPASAALLVQSDATTRVTAGAPAGAWNSSASFDDSGWQNATVLYDVGPAGIPEFAGTKGIWSSGGQFSTTELELWARKVFTVAGPLSAAELTVGCDDDCTVWVNGTQVVNDTNGFANNSTASVASLLTTGTNLVAWRVTDNWPVWGYQHSTWLRIDGTFATSSSVPEPASLALLGAGLLGLGLARRRR